MTNKKWLVYVYDVMEEKADTRLPGKQAQELADRLVEIEKVQKAFIRYARETFSKEVFELCMDPLLVRAYDEAIEGFDK